MPKLIDSFDMGEQRLDTLATQTTVQKQALELLQVRPLAVRSTQHPKTGSNHLLCVFTSGFGAVTACVVAGDSPPRHLFETCLVENRLRIGWRRDHRRSSAPAGNGQ